MDYITEKFAKLGVDNAPGQEGLQKKTALDFLCLFHLIIQCSLLSAGCRHFENMPQE